MTLPQQHPDQSDVGGPPFQFTLQTMLIVTTVLAVACSLLFATTGAVRIVSGVCLLIFFPAVLTTVLVYGRGYQRTFCIGALFPAGAALMSFQYLFAYFSMIGGRGGDPEDFGLAVFIALSWAASVVVGLVACGVRWMVESSRGRRPPPEAPQHPAEFHEQPGTSAQQSTES